MKNTLEVKDSIIPPYQPDIERKPCYKSYVIEPASPVNGIISDFYQFSTDERGNTCARILPDACTYMIFELNPFAMRPFLFTCVQSLNEVNLAPNTEYFCTRFFPCTIGNYFSCHIDDILNKPKYLDEIMPRVEYAQLIHDLCNSNYFNQRIYTVTKFIVKKHTEVKEFKNILLYTRDHIITSGGTIDIDTLAKETNYSQRYLRKLFQNYIGISPKTFCEIVKFQKSFAISCLWKEYTLCDIAYLCGYYDHPQMNKAYLRLVDYSPSKLRQILHI